MKAWWDQIKWTAMFMGLVLIFCGITFFVIKNYPNDCSDKDKIEIQKGRA